MATFDPALMAAQLQTLADDFIATTGTPASLLKISGGGLEVSVAAGRVDADHPAPASPNNTYEIGSQTKMMVSAVMLQLAEAGLVDLSRPATDYLPPTETDGIANVGLASLTQLLAMRSGIPDYTTVQNEDGEPVLDQMLLTNPDQFIGVGESLDIVRGLDPLFPPGHGWDYSNTNYHLIGRVIEVVTGQPLGDVLEALIFEPLGMEDTFLNDHLINDPRLSAYYPIEGELLDVTEAPIDLFAEGGVISTLDDMVTFMEGLIGGEILSEDAMSAMASWDIPDVDAFSTYGLGLFYIHADGLGDLIGHSGGTYGTETSTFAHLQSGRILTMADTLADFQMLAIEELVDLANSWGEVNLADGPITIEGVSALEMRVRVSDGATHLELGAAKLILDAPTATLGSDALVFADGSELTFGTQSDDQVTATGTGAVLRGLGGDDILRGSSKTDRLIGNDGADTLVGKGGADLLSGGQGQDLLRGGVGADRLIGGAGDDLLFGGKGADVFVFGRRLDNGTTETDVIQDFDLSNDALCLAGEITALRETDAGVALTLEGADGDQVFLVDVTLGMIEQDGLTVL